jgi:hypothetical protein
VLAEAVVILNHSWVFIHRVHLKINLNADRIGICDTGCKETAGRVHAFDIHTLT